MDAKLDQNQLREELPLFILSRRGNMVALLLEPHTAPTQEYVFLGRRGK